MYYIWFSGILFFSLSLRLVDGVEVIQESQFSVTSPTSGIASGLPSDPSTTGAVTSTLGITLTDYSPPSGHADAISDITMVHGSQPYVISASKDGVIKVWK